MHNAPLNSPKDCPTSLPLFTGDVIYFRGIFNPIDSLEGIRV